MSTTVPKGGRPLSAHGHLDSAALRLIELRERMRERGVIDIAIAREARELDRALRQVREAITGEAA